MVCNFPVVPGVLDGRTSNWGSWHPEIECYNHVIVTSPQPVKVKGLEDEPCEATFSHHVVLLPFWAVASAGFVVKVPVTRQPLPFWTSPELELQWKCWSQDPIFTLVFCPSTHCVSFCWHIQPQHLQEKIHSLFFVQTLRFVTSFLGAFKGEWHNIFFHIMYTQLKH